MLVCAYHARSRRHGLGCGGLVFDCTRISMAIWATEKAGVNKYGHAVASVAANTKV